jgi:hypothetical protein
MTGTPRDDHDPNLSERLLDKEEDESDKGTLENKARSQAEELTKASEEDHQRSDNQSYSERILDKKDSEEEDQN